MALLDMLLDSYIMYINFRIIRPDRDGVSPRVLRTPDLLTGGSSRDGRNSSRTETNTFQFYKSHTLDKSAVPSYSRVISLPHGPANSTRRNARGQRIIPGRFMVLGASHVSV